ncbi:MAG: exodeoxyribonuclease VII large subunit [Candidatus Eremiobacteraeota bacterium]|nr:exodeoxyribonuclease VII large subunit [Candidatus Eremiobacteraeota bacterium]
MSQEPLALALPRVEGVSRVVAYLGKLISQNKTLAGIRVRGEISGLSRHHSGRMYFDLKERTDVLKCVVWASAAMRLPLLKDGDEAIVSGEFGTFAQRSQYQLFVNAAELTGLGNLYTQYEALKEAFRREGLFDAGRKRALPAFPTRVALVSANGKGAEDFLATMNARAPHVAVTFVETRMQGDGAQIDVADAIDRASQMDVDVIVVTRGGGSYEDLFAFNLEPVVRAILRSQHPVLSAIGHTGDVHLSDLVADVVCETPSNAAQYFGQIRDAFARRVHALEAQLLPLVRAEMAGRSQALDYAAGAVARAARSIVQERRQHTLALESRLNRQTPVMRVAARSQRLGTADSGLGSLAKHLLGPRRERLTAATERLIRVRGKALTDLRNRLAVSSSTLSAADPRAPLGRGYAIVTANGRTLRAATDVSAGAVIQAQLQHGTLVARVEQTNPDG